MFFVFESDVASSASGGTISVVPRDRNVYTNQGSIYSFYLSSTPLTWTPIVGLVTALNYDNSTRLDINFQGTQIDAYFQYISFRLASVTYIPQSDLIVSNLNPYPSTIMLPNGEQYSDIFGKLVTYSIDLPAFGSIILFDFGYNSSLYVPPSSTQPTTTATSSQTGSNTPSGSNGPSSTNSNNESSNQSETSKTVETTDHSGTTFLKPFILTILIIFYKEWF